MMNAKTARETAMQVQEERRQTRIKVMQEYVEKDVNSLIEQEAHNGKYSCSMMMRDCETRDYAMKVLVEAGYRVSATAKKNPLLVCISWSMN